MSRSRTRIRRMWGHDCDESQSLLLAKTEAGGRYWGAAAPTPTPTWLVIPDNPAAREAMIAKVIKDNPVLFDTSNPRHISRDILDYIIRTALTPSRELMNLSWLGTTALAPSRRGHR